MSANSASIVDNGRTSRLSGKIQFGEKDEAGKLAAEAGKKQAASIEYEAAKWLGPWTVLINRRIGGTLFRTPAQDAR
jgi:hypothetical protein